MGLGLPPGSGQSSVTVNLSVVILSPKKKAYGVLAECNYR